jgi:hypothetical protein
MDRLSCVRGGSRGATGASVVESANYGTLAGLCNDKIGSQFDIIA